MGSGGGQAARSGNISQRAAHTYVQTHISIEIFCSIVYSAYAPRDVKPLIQCRLSRAPDLFRHMLHFCTRATAGFFVLRIPLAMLDLCLNAGRCSGHGGHCAWAYHPGSASLRKRGRRIEFVCSGYCSLCMVDMCSLDAPHMEYTACASRAGQNLSNPSAACMPCCALMITAVVPQCLGYP